MGIRPNENKFKIAIVGEIIGLEADPKVYKKLKLIG